MRSEEIMKKTVKCSSADETVGRAAKMMREHNVGFLPICDDQKRVLGTITDRDIAIRVVADDKPNGTRLRDVMTTDIISCRPDDDVERAAELMGAHQKSRMLVLDDQKHLVGVISLSDIAQKSSDKSAAKAMRDVSQRESGRTNA
jgi:CBS domain-containing protein